MRALGQGAPTRLHRGTCSRGHRILLLLCAGEPVPAFGGNRAPAALMAYSIGCQEIQNFFPASQAEQVHVLPDCPAGKDVDRTVRALALQARDEEPVLPVLDVCSYEGALHDGIGERAGCEPLPLVVLRREEGAKPCLILFLAQVIDQVVAVVANEDLVLFDDLDERLHPARRRFNRQAGGVGGHNHPDLALLHCAKQAGKRLAALAELLVIREIPQLAVVRCRINRGLAVVIYSL